MAASPSADFVPEDSSSAAADEFTSGASLAAATAAEKNPAWSSYGNLLGIQTLNAFNDNVTKFLLVGLAASTIGESVYKNLAFGLNAAAFILFAPLAGWMSDRYSKRGVLVAMLWMQLACLALIGIGPLLGHWLGIDPGIFRDPARHPGLLSLEMLPITIATIGFFTICVQATLFSPAKLGIVIELLGRRRLGFANSWLSMLTMVAIILGAMVGGEAFKRLATTGAFGWGPQSPWLASVWPLVPLLIVSTLALWSGYAMQRTPAGAPRKLTAADVLSHPRELKLLFANADQGRTALLKAWAWFVAVFVNLAMIDAVREVVGTGAAADALVTSRSAILVGVMGIGIILGSVLTAAISRRRIELGLIPTGAAIVGILLLALAGQKAELDSNILYPLNLVGIGIGASFLLIPLSAHLQAIASPERRGSVIAGSSLVDNAFQAAAAVAQVALAKGLGWSVAWQLVALGVATLLVGILAFRSLSQQAIVANLRPLFSALWRMRVFGAERMPEHGGVLLLPNHVSFADAFVLSTASPRPLRFVIEERYYTMWWAHWFLRWMGCIPITQRKAREAIRIIRAALEKGDVICLFPEGELTRNGQMRPLRRGFETIVRLANAPVVPARMSGLFRSLLAHSDGGMFWKRPTRLKVTVSFGHPLTRPEQLDELEQHYERLDRLNRRLRPATTPDTHRHPESVIPRKPEPVPEIKAALRKVEKPEEETPGQ